MRATALEVTETSALVELRPCWLARMFGARTVVAGLRRLEAETTGSRSFTITTRAAGWHAIATGRRLAELEHAALIRGALDFRPRAEVPRATARPT